MKEGRIDKKSQKEREGLSWYSKKRKERKRDERRNLMKITRFAILRIATELRQNCFSFSYAAFRFVSARLRGRIGEQTYRKPRIYPCGHWPAAKPPTVTQLIRIDPSVTSERAPLT